MSFCSSITSHNAKVLKELEIGDLVEFSRHFYNHWGVFVGNEDIVHLIGCKNDWISGVQFIGEAIVKKENFWKVADGCKTKKNNSKDKTRRPRPPYQIERDACASVGKTENVHFLLNNCEHFASYLSYGKKSSDQVSLGSLLLGGAAVAVVGIFGGLLAGALILNSKIKENRDDESNDTTYIEEYDFRTYSWGSSYRYG
ncbi:phospholipase A and acyltransferase 2-like [Pecten maximus]|uniref:phospholipase A and acyltransferase 2-like n=1 Tax=Pecten maximus TaxID=6579 RepID=UPI001458CD51|nr:phospholipase A and acyltransferase 2-like [Pecten maximus]